MRKGCLAASSRIKVAQRRGTTAAQPSTSGRSGSNHSELGAGAAMSSAAGRPRRDEVASLQRPPTCSAPTWATSRRTAKGSSCHRSRGTPPGHAAGPRPTTLQRDREASMGLQCSAGWACEETEGVPSIPPNKLSPTGWSLPWERSSVAAAATPSLAWPAYDATSDPAVPRDPGAGVIGDDAAKHLIHYFGNRGSTYTIDLDAMVREVPTARELYEDEVGQAKEFVELLLPGRHDITSRQTQNGYNEEHQSATGTTPSAGTTFGGAALLRSRTETVTGNVTSISSTSFSIATTGTTARA